MKTITVGFSKNANSAIGSKLIMWFLKENFSHTYLKVQLDSFSEPCVFHASGKGLNLLAYTTFKEHNTVVAEFELTISDELYTEMCNEFHKKCGVKYGYLQNIGILVATTFKLRKNPIDDGINCSEWLAYCLEEIYPTCWDSTKQDFNLVTPKHIYRYLTKDKNG